MVGNERGAVLLEVLAAVAIIAFAGVAFVELVGMGAYGAATARLREREGADQERLLAAWSLLSRRDLDQRLGRRGVGSYLVEVQRPERGLYRIAVGRLETPEVEDLVTVVWRPGDERDVAP